LDAREQTGGDSYADPFLTLVAKRADMDAVR
jgi:hypothetical protein